MMNLIKRLFIGTVLLSLAIACQKKEVEPVYEADPLAQHLPLNYDFLIQVNHPESLQELLAQLASTIPQKRQSELWGQWQLLLQSKLPARSWIGFSDIGKDQLDFLLISQTPLTHSMSPGETVNYQDVVIATWEGLEYPYFSATWSGVSLMSSSKLMIENAIRQKKVVRNIDQNLWVDIPENQNRLVASIDQNAWATDMLPLQIGGSRTHRWGTWSSSGVSKDSTGWSLTGITSARDSIDDQLINLWSEQKPTHTKLTPWIPSTAQGIWRFGISDENAFQKRQERWSKIKWPKTRLTPTPSELALVYMATDTLYYMFLDDEVNTEAWAKPQPPYKSYPIWHTQLGKELMSPWMPMMAGPQEFYATHIDEVWIFSRRRSALTLLIDHWEVGATINKSALEESFRYALEEKSNISYYGLAVKGLYPETAQGLSSGKIAAYWAFNSTGYWNHLVHWDPAPKNNPSGIEVQPLFQWKAEVVQAPKLTWLIDPRGNPWLIAQSQTGITQCMDVSGALQWEAELAPGAKAIAAIDLYENGRVQWLFEHEQKRRLLDKSGQDVRILWEQERIDKQLSQGEVLVKKWGKNDVDSKNALKSLPKSWSKEPVNMVYWPVQKSWIGLREFPKDTWTAYKIEPKSK